MREVTMIEEDRWTEVPGLSVTVTTKKSHEKVLLVPRHEKQSNGQEWKILKDDEQIYWIILEFGHCIIWICHDLSTFAKQKFCDIFWGWVKNQSSYRLSFSFPAVCLFSSEVWSTNFNPEELTYEAYFTVAWACLGNALLKFEMVRHIRLMRETWIWCYCGPSM